MNTTWTTKRASLALMALAMAGGLVGCDEDGSHGGAASGQPNIRFTDVKITQTEANFNDIITVSWKYTGTGTVKTQAVEFLSWDCNGLNVDRRTIAASARSYTFNFRRPITVHVIADTTKGTTDFALEVHRAEAYHFTIQNLYNSHPQLLNTGNAARGTPGAMPVAGSRTGGRQAVRNFERVNPEIRFDHFMGWMDGNENGFIDLMATGEEGIQLPTSEDFFMHSVGSVAQPCEGGFGCMPFTSGSAYAAITNGLHDDAARGYQVIDIPPDMDLTNVVVFAAAIVNDGMVLSARDQKGNAVAARQNITRFDTLFCGIEIAGHNGQGAISNIALGNVRQGMVVNAFRDGLANTHPGQTIDFHSYYRHPNAPSKGGEMDGEIIQAILGLRLSGATTDAAARQELGFNDGGVYVRIGKLGNKPHEHTGLTFHVPFFWDDDVRFDLCERAR